MPCGTGSGFLGETHGGSFLASWAVLLDLGWSTAHHLMKMHSHQDWLEHIQSAKQFCMWAFFGKTCFFSVFRVYLVRFL